MQISFDWQCRLWGKRWTVLRLWAGSEMVNVSRIAIRTLVGTLVATDLYRALEMHLHRVGEFECLEMCVWQNWSTRTEILNFRESRHEFRPSDATTLVDELNWCPFAIMCHAIPYQHIEFGVVVFNRQHHCHRLTDFHEARHFRSPWTFADLYLHPAANIIAGEIGAHYVQHVNWERTECDTFFVLIVPRAAQFSSLIPHLLHLRIILNDNDVLKVRARASFRSIAIQSVVGVACGATCMNANVKGGRCASETGRQMNAVDVAVVSLRENDAIEGFVELQENFHPFLFALYVQCDDFRSIGHRRCPQFIGRRRRSQLLLVANLIWMDFARMQLRRKWLMLHSHMTQMCWRRWRWSMVR